MIHNQNIDFPFEMFLLSNVIVDLSSHMRNKLHSIHHRKQTNIWPFL